MGGLDVAGGKLKETGTTHWISNTAATNSSGFTALPGGNRNGGSGTFGYIGQYGNWWSSTVDSKSSSLVWYRAMYHYANNVNGSTVNKTYGYSVRCLKN